MSGASDRAVHLDADVRAPSGATAPYLWQRCAGTGTTADANVTALVAEQWATLLVGATAVRFGFGADEAAAITACSATSPCLPAFARYDWVVTAGLDQFIAIEAQDGASAYEGHVYTSSGPRS